MSVVFMFHPLPVIPHDHRRLVVPYDYDHCATKTTNNTLHTKGDNYSNNDTMPAINTYQQINPYNSNQSLDNSCQSWDIIYFAGGTKNTRTVGDTVVREEEEETKA